MFNTEFLIALLILITVAVSVVKSNRFGWLLFLLIFSVFVISPILMLAGSIGPSSPASPQGAWEDIMQAGFLTLVFISGLIGMLTLLWGIWLRFYQKQLQKATRIIKCGLWAAMPMLVVISIIFLL